MDVSLKYINIPTIIAPARPAVFVFIIVKATASALSLLEIEISVLSPQVEIAFNSEDELLDQLNPFQDGLSLEDGYRHSTFLPSVWDVIPDKKTFLMKLKQKAGLSPTHWSDTLKAFRYQTISMHEKLE